MADHQQSGSGMLQAPMAVTAPGVRIDAVGCGGGARSAANFCVNGHVDGIASGGTGFAVRFTVVNEFPTDPAYNSSQTVGVNLATNPPSWSFGPGALAALAAAEAVVLTAELLQNGKAVLRAGSDSSAFTLNP